MKRFLEIVQGIEIGRIPKVDYHMHTTWTDGAHTVKEMFEASCRAGLSDVLFSEHARKTSGDWFGQFAQEVRGLPHTQCRAYVGVETKIADFEGHLDCTDEILEKCDLVMASVHRFPGEEGVVKGFDDVDLKTAEECEFRLAMAALDNPQVDILGHPFGMCTRRFRIEPSESRMQALIEKAAKTGVAIEINAHYHADPWLLVTWCKQAGAIVSLGSNAHRAEEVGRITRVMEGTDGSVSH